MGEEEIPSQEEPSVHIDTGIHVETVEISVHAGDIHIEGPVIDVPDHKSDSSSSSSSESDGEGVLPTEDGEKKKKVKRMKVKKEKKPKEKKEKKPKEKKEKEKKDKDIKISVVDGVTIEEEVPTQEEPSVHIDTDIHVEGVLPAEDGEKKTKVKKMKVKKEKKEKDIKISVVDGVTIEEDIPTQDEPSVHIDTV